MKKLFSLQHEVLEQFMVQEHIFPALAQPLKKDILQKSASVFKTNFLKIGLTSMLAIGVLASTNAQAGRTLNTMLGISAAAGYFTHNTQIPDLPPGCNVQGVSGWKVGGAAATGSWVGSKVGKGKGNKIATIAGAVLGGGGAYYVENSRIDREKEECLRAIQYRQQLYNSAYNANQATASALILYSYQDRYGSQHFVSSETSTGLAALRGETYSNREIYQNPQAQSNIEQALRGLITAYAKFEQASDKYIQLENNNNQTSRGKQARQNSVREWDASFTQYAQERAFAVAVFDNFAKEGYNLTPYSNKIILFTPPANATIACECNLPNRYSTVPSRLTAMR